jgi:hypothetical protein
MNRDEFHDEKPQKDKTCPVVGNEIPMHLF